MATVNFDNAPSEKKVRAALHRDVRNICTECCHLLGLNISKDAMEVIAELLFMKMSVYATDLEAFAKHAKRALINADDVKLMARRNLSLKTHLNNLHPSNPTTKDKRRKTVSNVTKQPETPSAKQSLDLLTTKAKETEIIATKEAQPSTSKSNFVESMVVDDAIDLTFDE